MEWWLARDPTYSSSPTLQANAGSGRALSILTSRAGGLRILIREAAGCGGADVAGPSARALLGAAEGSCWRADQQAA